MRNKYLKESWITPKVNEMDSLLHEKGLFAKEPINKGEVVVIWGGNFVNETEARKAKEEGRAIQQIDNDLWDVFDYETRNDDLSYNHNHSCNPNTWMRDEVTIIARRKIKPEEELTIDYVMFVLDENYKMPNACKCGTTLCRQTITGKDWQLSKLQKRYKNNFNPGLNKRIKKLNEQKAQK
ncbi:MAG TPA: SET domain-containing protein-lysine N-methyltransferase [Candidatus Nanoarchaeia archaeon]|nr:SET domain-containing protein-lysine N-methyltransferase [Candidatus Nanoarchaeia archaeon]